jgi:hypothetical protein
MNVTPQIAKLAKDSYYGENWTDVSLQQTLAGVTWKQATTSIYDLNTIAALVYHINYFVTAVSKVLAGGPLDASDTLSFDHLPIQSEEDWLALVQGVSQDIEQFAGLIAALPDSALDKVFVEEKYGNYYRNLHGVIEHLYYHMGQIVLLKKILSQKDDQ